LFKKLYSILGIILVATVVLSVGCIPKESDQKSDSTIKPSSIISPSIKINEEYYRGVLPYKTSPIAGMLKEIPSRLDTNHFELGLLELAKASYDPSTYVFQEGQVLTMNEIEPLLDDKQYPEFKNFVYAVSEQDYLQESGEFGGIVVGILVSPKYRIADENGNTIEQKYTQEELEGKSKKLIQEVGTMIRKKVQNTSILFAVMQIEEDDMKKPGTFFLTGTMKENENSVSEFNQINESYLFLPASSISINDEYGDVSLGFNHFIEKVDEYLPGFAGVTGLGRVVNGDLVELTAKVYTEFDSTIEVIQFTQFAIAMLPEYFPKNIQVNLYIYSIDQPKAIYVKQANGDDFMHIYRN